MELIYFLVLFPFLSALLLSVTKSQNVRRGIVYLSSAAIIGVAVTFAIQYFQGGQTQSYLTSTHTIDMIMLGIEAGLMVLICVLAFKYKKYYVAALSVFQTLLTGWYELFEEPEQEITHVFIDNLTVIMILIIAIVGTLITVYAAGYMKDYHNHHTEFKDRRPFFFSMLYVFLGAMFGLVVSSNLVWIYFFWEITSVISFLLIGYTKTGEAIHNCFRALWMNLLGGLGFAVAIVYAGMALNITDLQVLIKQDSALVIVPVILLSFAGLTKSAQLPFSKWLLGAMVAPTPSSALLHSATMVKAGVYLLLRLAPVLAGNLAGTMVSLVGGFTFLIASMLAITVSDGKKVLAYSTISNLGLITACAGVGVEETVWAGMFLLIFHAISKSLLFQTVGAIENTTGSRDIESMHGLVKLYPILGLTLVVGIAGMFLAPFGMLISKWAALKAFIDSGSILLVLFICFGSATTLFYWAKWLATVLSSVHSNEVQKNKTSRCQLFSLGVHTIMMVLVCFAFPVVSSKVIMPFVSGVYSSAVEVLAKDNIIIMIIMLAGVFVIPGITYIGTKHAKYKKVDRYISGVNTGDQESFVDSHGKRKEMVLSNWYMEDIFGKKILWTPSIVISVLIVVIPILVVVGGAFA